MEPMAASELLIARSSVAVVIMVACPAPFSVPRSICDRHEDAEHREACNSSKIILAWDSSAYFPKFYEKLLSADFITQILKKVLKREKKN